MTKSDNEVSLDTLKLLESRLLRLEFNLAGDKDATRTASEISFSTGKDQSISGRLARLESSLGQLSSRSEATSELLSLQAQYPDLFNSIPPSQKPTALDTTEMLAIVLASASLYHSTTSRLTSISDVPVPPAESSAALITLQPRIAKVGLEREAQAREIAELRQRTAAVLERWYEVAVLGGGECWAEWEERVQQAERTIRRAEMIRERDDSFP
ncbi:MAG: hypothetical protein M1824_001752 [Vezdaea acicularis]|nr:MAG: hypothetical protein M1824_001752 [Vezdaea acicularis]